MNKKSLALRITPCDSILLDNLGSVGVGYRYRKKPCPLVMSQSVFVDSIVRTRLPTVPSVSFVLEQESFNGSFLRW